MCFGKIKELHRKSNLKKQLYLNFNAWVCLTQSEDGNAVRSQFIGFSAKKRAKTIILFWLWLLLMFLLGFFKGYDRIRENKIFEYHFSCTNRFDCSIEFILGISTDKFEMDFIL